MSTRVKDSIELPRARYKRRDQACPRGSLCKHTFQAEHRSGSSGVNVIVCIPPDDVYKPTGPHKSAVFGTLRSMLHSPR